MQKSKRLIRHTIFALNAIAVLYVGVNRLYATGDPPAHGASASNPAALRDFDEIEVNGDVHVDVTHGADYAVAFSEPNADEGNPVATVRDRTLVLRGTDNGGANRVRVAVPELKQLRSSGVSIVAISGFDGEQLSLRLDGAAQVILRDNGIRRWHIAAVDVVQLTVDQASIASARFDLAGDVTLRVVD